jgi:hypothetical protein
MDRKECARGRGEFVAFSRLLDGLRRIESRAAQQGLRHRAQLATGARHGAVGLEPSRGSIERRVQGP